MKFPLRSVVVVFALLASSGCAEDARLPDMVRIEVQMVSVPEAKALELLPNLRDAGSIDGAFSEIQKLITSKQARLIAWPEIATKSGLRAVSESIREYRYLTLPEPAKAKPGEDTPATPKANDSSAQAPTFETRNTGATLEIEPTLGPDGRTIDLSIVPQLVYPLAGDGHTPVAVGEQEFMTAKVTVSVSMQSGQRMLLGVFPMVDAVPELLFFILKADVVPTPKVR